MFRFLRNPKLLDTVESLVGGEILCHPTQHLRAVLPTALKDLTRTVDWHQDAAVLRPEANDHLIVTIWIPIVDVTEEQGCLQVLPGSQRSRHRYEPTNGHRVAPAGRTTPGSSSAAAPVRRRCRTTSLSGATALRSLGACSRCPAIPACAGIYACRRIPAPLWSPRYAGGHGFPLARE